MAAAAFTERLRQAFDLRDVNTTMARVDKLISATGCCRRTAFRWLSGGTTPCSGGQIIQIAAALDVDPAWLSGTSRDNPLLAAVVRKFLRLPPELQLDLMMQLDRLLAGTKPARD